MNRVFLFIVIFLMTSMTLAMAAGMVPETSLLIVNEAEGGASMDVKNTDNQAVLLYTQIKNLPDDPHPQLLVTQPVVRVEAGKTQRVRFILKNSSVPLETEHLKRVIFTSIPQMGDNQVKVGFSQDLPVIIQPKSLDKSSMPWKTLKWNYKGNVISVLNDTPYVIRLGEEIRLLPSKTIARLPQTYILPNKVLQVKLSTKDMVIDNSVEIYPATRYGYVVDKFIAKFH